MYNTIEKMNIICIHRICKVIILHLFVLRIFSLTMLKNKILIILEDLLNQTEHNFKKNEILIMVEYVF